jgi:hypothetical protein
LHSGGVAVYIDRYLEPAFFGATEAEDDIQRYSRKLGEIARIARMPHRADFPNGILASWGKVELEPLDNDTITVLAEGRDPTTNGYLVDFIGDFARSAKERLPIYRISGGAGFVWVASFNQRGRGTLRLTAVDAFLLALTTTPSAPIETVESEKEKDAIANSTNQLSEAYQKSAGQGKIDAEPAREDAEAREEAVRARADIDRAAATQRAKVLVQLEADKSAAEGAHAMEFVGYGTVIVLIVLVMVVASARIQKTQAAWLRRRPKSLKSHRIHQIQG